MNMGSFLHAKKKNYVQVFPFFSIRLTDLFFSPPSCLCHVSLDKEKPLDDEEEEEEDSHNPIS